MKKAINLIGEDQADKAVQVLARAEKELPDENVTVDYQSGSLDMARAYALVGNKKMAQDKLEKLFLRSEQYLRWYCSLSGNRFYAAQQDCMYHFYIMEKILQTADLVDEKVACAGYAIRRQYDMTFKADRTGPRIRWIVWIPAP